MCIRITAIVGSIIIFHMRTTKYRTFWFFFFLDQQKNCTKNQIQKSLRNERLLCSHIAHCICIIFLNEVLNANEDSGHVVCVQRMCYLKMQGVNLTCVRFVDGSMKKGVNAKLCFTQIDMILCIEKILSIC